MERNLNPFSLQIDTSGNSGLQD